MMIKWKPGDRVVRRVFSDDGTWNMFGDDCLKYSPAIHGTVTKRSSKRDDEVWVMWDSGRRELYLDHGLEEETDKTVYPRSVALGSTRKSVCPKCGNSLQNVEPSGSPELRRCADCTTIFHVHIREVMLSKQDEQIEVKPTSKLLDFFEKFSSEHGSNIEED